MQVMEELLTVEEVAKILKASEAKIKRLLREGQMSGYKVGVEWRVSRSDLQEYLNKQRNTGKK